MPVGSDAIPADLASIQQGAAQEFATAAMSALEGAPSTAAPEAPTQPTEQAPPPQPAPVAPPAQAAPQTDTASAPQPAPAPAATSPGLPSIDVSTWSPEARRALEMEGWDGKSAVTPDLLGRVSSRYLEFNNRLGAKGSPEEKPQAQAAPPEDAEAQVSAHIVREQDADPECAQMVSEFQVFNAELQKLGDENSGQIGKTRGDLEYVKRLQELPDIKENPLRLDEVRSEQRRLELELVQLRAEARLRKLDIRDLETRYDNRATLIERSIRGNLETRAAINSRATELAQQWPGLVQKVADNAKLPKELHGKFFEDAKREFVLAQRAGERIPNLEAFLAEIADRRLKDMDEYHRIKSGEYGALAAKRADTVSPPTPSVPGAPGAAPATNAPKSLSELYANIDAERYATIR